MTHAATVATPIGTVRLTADEKGLTGIVLPGESSSTWQEEKDRTDIRHPLLKAAADQIREYFAGHRRVFELPLSLSGTPFQLRVWDIIRRIPYGETMSYRRIAGMLGNPNKARAVGGAAHANPLPLVIPCHRVVGSDGSLTGFAGGLELKKLLLDLERNTPPARPASLSGHSRE